MHKYGSCPILNLLSPLNTQYFDPVTVKLFAYPTTGKPTCTSKKPAETRRAELLAALLPPLVAACEASARDLLCSLPGSRVLAETFFAAEGAARQALAEAVARCVAATDPSDDSRHGKAGLDDAPDEEDAGPAAHAIGHKAVQKLLAREAAAAPDGARPLWEALRAALQSFEKVDVRLTVWAKHNRMAFVLVEFVKTAPAARRADVRALFAPVVKALRALPADSLCAGASRLLEVLQ